MPATPDRNSRAETILAFDFGLRRIGVAVGQTVTGSATPLGVVGNGTAGPDWRRIDRLVQEWKPARLVVGMPLAEDGLRSAIGAQVSAFMRDLERFSLPVTAIDERYSSLEAAEKLVAVRRLGLRGRIGREAIDAAAAALIAERWLRQRDEESAVDSE
jgi:putative holliday junction resolvase